MAAVVSAIRALLIGRHNGDARDQRASNWEGDSTISELLSSLAPANLKGSRHAEKR
jgi:hypothetical protein